MKLLQPDKGLRMGAIALVFFIIGFFHANAAETGESVGASTNGIYATAKYLPSEPGGANIRVYVHFRPPSTNIPTISPFPSTLEETNEVFVPDTDRKYFLATNSFCGFVELKNESGEQIKLLKPAVNSPAAYPAAYNLKLTSKLLEGKIDASILPGCLSGMDPVQCSFHLQKYFKIEKPGDYRLTVWPKIYEKSETNQDIV